MWGLPEPIRLWDWHLRQQPRPAGRTLAPRATACAVRLAGTAALAHGAAPARLPGAAAPPRAPLARAPGLPPGPAGGAVRRRRGGAARPAGRGGPGAEPRGSRARSSAPRGAREISGRMAASLADERAPFLEHYRQFRYAVPRRAARLRGARPRNEKRGCSAPLFDGRPAPGGPSLPLRPAELGDAVTAPRTTRAGPSADEASARNVQLQAAGSRRRTVEPYRPASRSSVRTGRARAPSPNCSSASRCPFPVKRIYMGVNLEASTPDAAHHAARARGQARPRPAAGHGGAAAPAGAQHRTGRGRADRAAAKEAARLGVWVAEEWLRQLVAARLPQARLVVVFDRHFYADYYHSDVARAAAGGQPSRAARLAARSTPTPSPTW